MNAAMRDKNIVLIGFMGVGKTTIGQLLSKKLDRDFIDIDQQIENDFQMTIPEMFKQKGEAFFRQTEREYIFQMCEHTMGSIVSLGEALSNRRTSERSVSNTALSSFLI